MLLILATRTRVEGDASLRPRKHPFIPDAIPRRVEFGEDASVAPLESHPVLRESAAATGVRSGSILLLVVDEQFSPIARAHVVCSDGEVRQSEQTDPLGQARFDLWRPGEVRISAAAQGFATRDAIVQFPEGSAPAEARIVLQRAGRIVGQVRWKASQRPAAGATVGAWRTGHAPSSAERGLIEAALPTENLLTARAGEDGSFVVTGAIPGRRYSLAAALEGGACLHEVHGALAGDEPLLLEVVPVHACIVRLRETGGGALRTGSNVFGRGPGWYDESHAEAEVVRGVPAGCQLILDDSASSLGPTSLPDQLVLFNHEREDVDVLDVVYEVEVPGYAPVWTRLQVPRIARRPPTVMLGLDARAMGWGTVTVRVDGPSLDLEPTSGAGAVLGEVLLRGEAGFRIGVPIRKPLARSSTIAGVPFGQYSARFRSLDVQNYWPADAIETLLVVSATPVEYVVDARASAALLVGVRDRSGLEYAGSAVFRLHGNPGTSFVAFKGAPYVLEALRAGTADLFIDSLPGMTAVVDQPAPVVLEPGSVSTTVIVLPW